MILQGSRWCWNFPAPVGDQDVETGPQRKSEKEEKEEKEDEEKEEEIEKAVPKF